LAHRFRKSAALRLDRRAMLPRGAGPDGCRLPRNDSTESSGAFWDVPATTIAAVEVVVNELALSVEPEAAVALARPGFGMA
jgi:hypothetical protein